MKEAKNFFLHFCNYAFFHRVLLWKTFTCALGIFLALNALWLLTRKIFLAPACTIVGIAKSYYSTCALQATFSRFQDEDANKFVDLTPLWEITSESQIQTYSITKLLFTLYSISDKYFRKSTLQWKMTILKHILFKFKFENVLVF